MRLTLADLRYAIYDLRTAIAGDGRRSFKRSVRAIFLRVADPRSGGKEHPCKALGIKVRWALLGFVGPFVLKK
jgi:hypothetical protein